MQRLTNVVEHIGKMSNDLSLFFLVLLFAKLIDAVHTNIAVLVSILTQHRPQYR